MKILTGKPNWGAILFFIFVAITCFVGTIQLGEKIIHWVTELINWIGG